ncbi:MAG: DUF805 domain-containing protein [Pseudomonadota bacterium]
MFKSMWSLNGRVRRRDFIVTSLAFSSVYVALNATIAFIPGIAQTVTGLIVDAAFFWLVAVAGPYKRFHDLNRSGSFQLAFLALGAAAFAMLLFYLFSSINAVNSITIGPGNTTPQEMADSMHPMGSFGFYLMFVLIGLTSLIGFVGAMYLTFAPGTDGPNSYGPDPKAAFEVEGEKRT